MTTIEGILDAMYEINFFIYCQRRYPEVVYSIIIPPNEYDDFLNRLELWCESNYNSSLKFSIMVVDWTRGATNYYEFNMGIRGFTLNGLL